MKKMSKKHLTLCLTLLAAGLSACAPSEKQMTELLEKHPEILTNAIDKNPDKIMDAIQKAAQAAQGRAGERAAQAEKARLDEEFKNPLKPEVAEARGFMGKNDAKLTIVEYTDFECPFCGRGYSTLEQVRKTYGDQVRVLVKNLPLPMHPMAMPAAKRFAALRLQSPEKAYAFYHEVFSNQQKLRDGEKYLDAAVKKSGANLAQVKKDMDSDRVTQIIQADMTEAEKFGITGTPGFIVDGVSVRGAYPFETFKEIIDRKLAAK